MFLIEIYRPDERYKEYEHTGYVCSSLDTVKQILINLFNEWSDGPDNGWSSLNDEVDMAKSLGDLSDVVSDFGCEVNYFFEFKEITDGQRFFLMDESDLG